MKNLHSSLVLLKEELSKANGDVKNYLHSSLVLLKVGKSDMHVVAIVNLHSSLVLLKASLSAATNQAKAAFTF